MSRKDAPGRLTLAEGMAPTMGEPMPGQDPRDARSWVQRVAELVAPLEQGDLSRLDLLDDPWRTQESERETEQPER